MNKSFTFNDSLVRTCFAPHPGYFFTGDGVRRDADGYYRISGRVDDVINVSGQSRGTVELESAISSHPAVADAGVVEEIIARRRLDLGTRHAV